MLDSNLVFQYMIKVHFDAALADPVLCKIYEDEQERLQEIRRQNERALQMEKLRERNRMFDSASSDSALQAALRARGLEKRLAIDEHNNQAIIILIVGNPDDDRYEVFPVGRIEDGQIGFEFAYMLSDMFNIHLETPDERRYHRSGW